MEPARAFGRRYRCHASGMERRNEYLSRTFTLRGPGTQLFLSFQPPHPPIMVSTIRRWVVDTLRAAGIESFTAHSTRAASTSAASVRGASLETICKAGGWSNARTFANHYHKVVDHQNFGNAVLQNYHVQ